MKSLIRIFSIYFILITFLPCSAGSSPCCEKNENTSFEILSFQNHQHDDDNDCEDNCSPYCLRTCCGSTILNFDHPPYKEIIENPIPVNNPSSSADFFPQIFLHKVWHPPKSFC